MGALIANKKLRSRSADRVHVTAAPATGIFKGALVVLQAGLAKPGFAATGLVAVGVADTFVAAGDSQRGFHALKGTFAFEQAGTPVTQAHIGQPAYIVDDQTVSLDTASNTRSPAGTIFDVTDDGVWIKF